MNKHLLHILAGLCISLPIWADDPLLTGTPIGSSPSVDYDNGSYPSTTTKNIPADAFDGDQSTFYASYARTGTWVGLDLGRRYVITRVGCAPRNDGNGPKRVQLARFEGANQPDFSDAFPIFINRERGTIGTTKRYDVSCSLGFRYVRYVGPADARCNVAEVEFYGHQGVGDSTDMSIAGGLPLVLINTTSGSDPVDKVNELPCVVRIISEDGELRDTATVRLRGNASKDFPKKPYRIKFAHKHHVLGSPAKAKKWTLINNYGDKTLMRNIIAFRTSEMLEMPYTPFCTPVNVIVNGDYKGCYQLCDQVEIHKNRIAVEDELTPRDANGLALTGGYFIEVDAYAYNEEAGHYFYSTRSTPVTIKSPGDSIITAQYNYIKSIFNNMESAVIGYSNWRQLLDENTFLRHFLVGELSGNTDTYWSVYMYKHRGEDKLYTGPVWDFDLAYDNDNRTYPVNNLSGYVYATKGSYAGDMRNFVNHIVVGDAQAKAELKRIWSIARDKGLTADYLCAYVDSVANVLDEAQQLNFIRWDIMNSWVHQNPQVSGSYQGEVNVVKNYLRKRVTWMDNKVGYTPGTWTGPDNTWLEEEADNQAEKVMIGGHVYIKRDNKLYDILGNIWNEK